MTKITNSKPRVRIAPSPTGPLHIGTARTALFNYLFAKKHSGAFVLRIEDTDLERSDPKWEEDIMDSLLWLGIVWTEGPKIPNYKSQITNKFKIQNSKFQTDRKYIGQYGPYRQSERLEIYANYLETLLREDKAYHCFCSEEELEAQRKKQMNRGEAPKYSGKCAKLSKIEMQKRLGRGEKSIIRFRTPQKKVIFHDLIRGNIEFDTGLIGDIAIAKDLATPLYNFAVVVDDFEMEITHVIRGEDHISNTPKQIILQEALGFPQPKYAHLPLILGPDRSKLSKRHGAVSISEYRKEGYLPEALVNFMAFLGWNPGTDKEIYSMEELLQDFSLENVQKASAVFNIQKLDYLNGIYIRKKPVDELTRACVPYLTEAELIKPEFKQKQYPPAYGGIEPIAIFKFKTSAGDSVDFEYIKKAVALYQERLKKLSEIAELTDFFFKDMLEYDKELLRWKIMTDDELLVSLDKLEEILSEIAPGDFIKENLEKILISIAESRGDRGKVLWPLRVALTGKEASAGPFEIAEILGKEKVLKRIKAAKQLF